MEWSLEGFPSILKLVRKKQMAQFEIKKAGYVKSVELQPQQI